MRMTILEKTSIDKIDVRSYPECEGGEIMVEFPSPHVEMELDLDEAIVLNSLLSSATQNVYYIREESKRHGN